jgi:predicted ATPase
MMTNAPFEKKHPAGEPNSGSRWHRWEPHIHAPGTLFNDQFGGPEKFDDYLKELETANPPIRALGVTDYYLTDSYECILNAKTAGRLPNVQLLFPNIEMRLDIGTIEGRSVNFHLLVCPDDPDHLKELRRFLERVTFPAYKDTFNCTKDDLIRLGQRVDPNTSGVAALRLGAQRFKVNLSEFRKTYNENAWAKANILIAAAGSKVDGTSGVREPADATLREEIESLAHIIFASSVAQREFWLGMRCASKEMLEERFGGLKPCMHGCDAHRLDSVALPDGDRYSWIKGALEFDALRQAVIDPAGRSYVGPMVPLGASSSQVISSITIGGAPWATTPVIPLNPGLVAIIGARGSGKTALADVIALACDATEYPLSKASFLDRAKQLLAGSTVSIRWQSGEEEVRFLDVDANFSNNEFPRARYLSQQFVNELCSSEGMTDKLLAEIERVIFEAHSPSESDGAADFDELQQLRAMRFREARQREEATLESLSEEIGTELEKQNQIEPLRKQIEEKEKLVKGFTNDRSKLVLKGSEQRVERFNAVVAAIEKVRANVSFFTKQEQTLLSLQDEVGNHRQFQAPEGLRRAREKYKESRIKPQDWDSFLLDYSGDVDGTLETTLDAARTTAKNWRGTPPPTNIDLQIAYVQDDAVLEKQPLALLEAERARLEKVMGGDQQTAARFASLSKTISQENAALERLRERLKDAEGAPVRRKERLKEREQAYLKVFEAIVSEQTVLRELYEPLMEHLGKVPGTLEKLSFSVVRKVDLESWASEGELLIDKRLKGLLKGRGTLRGFAESMLKGAWIAGSAQTVAAAMSVFRDKVTDEFLEQLKSADPETFRPWSKRFAKWLYGTDHIKIEYSIDYTGVDIRKLSPGTRGIVLLLLYLALDAADERPLIIDQPEENLDPKSIFDDLVGLFLAAKNKRQVIMVTHNANLVVNTDADQIIIAQVGTGTQGCLPPISYTSGGLETKAIRTAVCEILEGGDRAFKERARRLRVRLDR